MTKPNGWTDERVERIIGTLLRIGVLTAAAVVAAGGALYLVAHGGETPQYGAFRGEPRGLRSIDGILSGAGALEPLGVIQLGLLLLIATPVARVAFSAVAFAFQRDWAYVLITLIVLGTLVFSLANGSP